MSHGTLESGTRRFRAPPRDHVSIAHRPRGPGARRKTIFGWLPSARTRSPGQGHALSRRRRLSALSTTRPRERRPPPRLLDPGQLLQRLDPAPRWSPADVGHDRDVTAVEPSPSRRMPRASEHGDLDGGLPGPGAHLALQSPESIRALDIDTVGNVCRRILAEPGGRSDAWSSFSVRPVIATIGIRPFSPSGKTRPTIASPTGRFAERRTEVHEQLGLEVDFEDDPPASRGARYPGHHTCRRRPADHPRRQPLRGQVEMDLVGPSVVVPPTRRCVLGGSGRLRRGTEPVRTLVPGYGERASVG